VMFSAWLQPVCVICPFSTNVPVIPAIQVAGAINYSKWNKDWLTDEPKKAIANIEGMTTTRIFWRHTIQQRYIFKDLDE
jgi:hypothetical protein